MSVRYPLPPKARKHVEDLIAFLEANPDRYRQLSYGDGECGTPCCLAGMSGLLDSDPFPTDLDMRECGDHTTEPPAYREWIERRAAAMGLVCCFTPAIFAPEWPGRWLLAHGDKGNGSLFYPRPADAVNVLRRFLAGRFDDEPGFRECGICGRVDRKEVERCADCDAPILEGQPHSVRFGFRVCEDCSDPPEPQPDTPSLPDPWWAQR